MSKAVKCCRHADDRCRGSGDAARRRCPFASETASIWAALWPAPLLPVVVTCAGPVDTQSHSTAVADASAHTRTLYIPFPAEMSLCCFPCYDETSLLLSLRRRRFADARTAKDPFDRVVAFVARVLEHAVIVVPFERDLDRPRSRVDLRVVDRRSVHQRVRVDEREALGHLKALALQADPAQHVAWQEVGRFDNERAAVPATARVAGPGAHGGRRVRSAVDRNHADVVDHFAHDAEVP